MDKLMSICRLLTVPLALVLLFAVFSPLANAATPAQVYAALDSPAGVTLTELEYVEYVMTIDKEDKDWWFAWIEDDDDGNYKVKKTSSGNSKWTVQSKTADTTTPNFGGSCIYSTGVKDACAARIKLRVRGPGVLSFMYKTSCDYGDALNAYVDGEEAWPFDSDSGYGDDYGWEEGEVYVDGGLAEDGPTAGTYYHEIILEYFKDETEYDGKTAIPDGPEKPVRADYYDNQDYKEAVAEYNEEMKYFHDRVWIDNLRWAPEPVELRLDPDPNPINEEEDPEVAAQRGVFQDEVTVQLLSNAEDFGYQLRYTIDGSLPTANSPLYDESVGITLQQSATVRARVYDGLGKTTPVLVQPEIAIQGRFQAQMPSPVLTVDLQESTLDAVKCTATVSAAGANIYYTLSPSDWPDTLWPAAGVVLTEPGQIRALAVSAKTGTLQSEVVELSVIKVEPPTMTVVNAADESDWPATTLACQPGTKLRVNMTKPTDSAVVWRNEQEAASSWQEYSAPLQFTIIDEPVLLQARATQSGQLGSEVVKRSFYPALEKITFSGLGIGGALHEGWNLLSMPFSLTAESLATLQQQWPMIFAVETQLGALSKPDGIAQGEGFWLFCENENQPPLELTGAVTPNEEDAPKGGWCLLGPDASTKGSETFKAWAWQPEGGYKWQTLEPGQGGWKYCQ